MALSIAALDKLILQEPGGPPAPFQHKWRLLYSPNPMMGVFDGFRWCIFRGQSEPYALGLLASVVVIAFFYGLGLRQFRKTEKASLTLYSGYNAAVREKV